MSYTGTMTPQQAFREATINNEDSQIMVSDFISMLQHILKNFGDLPIYCQDSEQGEWKLTRKQLPTPKSLLADPRFNEFDNCIILP